MIRRRHTPGASERRLDIRHAGGELKCRVGHEEVEVLDVSIGGLRMARPLQPVRVGEQLRFEMLIEHNPAAIATIKVVTADWIALEFVRPNFGLLNSVCKHVAKLHGLTSTMGLARRRPKASDGEA